MRRLRLRAGRIDTLAAERNSAATLGDLEMALLYWWQDGIDDTREWQLVIKTTSEHLPALETHIKANHSYETPEITATEITWGSRGYRVSVLKRGAAVHGALVPA
jgi:periplasmic divalent cation tolerance protein